MRQKGWIVAGVPSLQDLAIERPASGTPSRLEHVWLELTNSCNLKCGHCYAASGPDADRSSELSLGQWLRVVDDALAFGVNKLTFIGGEPTIRLDLVEAISRHVREGTSSTEVTLRMFSNLAIDRVRDRTIEIVQKFNIEFGTALYGLDQVSHDRMTARKGSWQATVDSIRACVKSEVDVFVGMYLDMNDVRDVAVHEKWLADLGVRRFQVLAPSRVGRGTPIKWSKTPLRNKLPNPMAFDEHQWQVSRSGHNCFSDHLAVKPDGSVSPCIMMRSVSYGDIKTGIRSLLDTNAYREMASLSKDEIPGCKACEFRYACFDCRPDAMEGSVNFRAKPACGYDPGLELGAPLIE